MQHSRISAASNAAAVAVELAAKVGRRKTKQAQAAAKPATAAAEEAARADAKEPHGAGESATGSHAYPRKAKA